MTSIYVVEGGWEYTCLSKEAAFAVADTLRGYDSIFVIECAPYPVHQWERDGRIGYAPQFHGEGAQRR